MQGRFGLRQVTPDEWDGTQPPYTEGRSVIGNTRSICTAAGGTQTRKRAWNADHGNQWCRVCWTRVSAVGQGEIALIPPPNSPEFPWQTGLES